MKYKKSTIYDCFSNKTRVHLILCLESGKCVSDLLKQCNLSQSALSQHLKILKDSRIVYSERSGTKQIYAIRKNKALKIAKLLLELTKENI